MWKWLRFKESQELCFIRGLLESHPFQCHPQTTFRNKIFHFEISCDKFKIYLDCEVDFDENSELWRIRIADEFHNTIYEDGDFSEKENPRKPEVVEYLIGRFDLRKPIQKRAREIEIFKEQEKQKEQEKKAKREKIFHKYVRIGKGVE